MTIDSKTFYRLRIGTLDGSPAWCATKIWRMEATLVLIARRFVCESVTNL
jgi:hypothetical protein